MILYHVITTYHLIEAIVHRLIFHKDNKVILLFPDFGTIKFPQYKELADKGFFDEVILFPYEKIRHNNYEEDVIEQVKLSIPYSLFEMEKIYVAGAQFYFSYYLIANKIPFCFWEEAGGNLSRPEDWIMTMNKVAQYNYAIKYGLMTGENRNVVERICNLSVQKRGFSDELAVDFNLTDELSKLCKNDINRILQFFGVPQLSYKSNSIIVLTQHFAGLKMMTYEEQALMYSLVIDYFSKDYNLVFKCHPDDIMLYEEIFPNAQVIRQKFPAELLSFASEILPQAIMTISSTGIRNVKTIYSDVITFDVNFQNRRQYQKIHQYYIANHIIKRLTNIENTYLYEVIDVIANKFDKLSEGTILYLHELKNKISENDILVVDMCTCKKELEALFNLGFQTVIFLNTSGDYCFEDRLLEDDTNFVVKEFLIQDSLNIHSEYLFIYSVHREIKEMIYNMETQKTLEYSKIKISLHNMDSKDEEISILRGRLEAAEERLRYYIDKYENNGGNKE